MYNNYYSRASALMGLIWYCLVIRNAPRARLMLVIYEHTSLGKKFMFMVKFCTCIIIIFHVIRDKFYVMIDNSYANNFLVTFLECTHQWAISITRISPWCSCTITHTVVCYISVISIVDHQTCDMECAILSCTYYVM